MILLAIMRGVADLSDMSGLIELCWFLVLRVTSALWSASRFEGIIDVVEYVCDFEGPAAIVEVWPWFNLKAVWLAMSDTYGCGAFAIQYKKYGWYSVLSTQCNGKRQMSILTDAGMFSTQSKMGRLCHELLVSYSYDEVFS